LIINLKKNKNDGKRTKHRNGSHCKDRMIRGKRTKPEKTGKKKLKTVPKTRREKETGSV